MAISCVRLCLTALKVGITALLNVKGGYLSPVMHKPPSPAAQTLDISLRRCFLAIKAVKHKSERQNI